MGKSLKHAWACVGVSVWVASCATIKQQTAPPTPTAASAPSLRGATVMVFPIQDGPVPSADKTAHHLPVDRTALDAEIAYWLQQGRPAAKWILPEAIDKVIARTPGLGIDARRLAVGSFYRAQVKNIGDPLFGDLRRLAAVLDGQLSLIPVAAEYLGPTPATATLQIAAAVIAMDGRVLWFGVIEGKEKGVSEAAIASAAQTFANAFSGRK
jgi:hypothetical protein